MRVVALESSKKGGKNSTFYHASTENTQNDHLGAVKVLQFRCQGLDSLFIIADTML